jgi:hypothetical protein
MRAEWTLQCSPRSAQARPSSRALRLRAEAVRRGDGGGARAARARAAPDQDRALRTDGRLNGCTDAGRQRNRLSAARDLLDRDDNCDRDVQQLRRIRARRGHSRLSRRGHRPALPAQRQRARQDRQRRHAALDRVPGSSGWKYGPRLAVHRRNRIGPGQRPGSANRYAAAARSAAWSHSAWR